MRNDGNMLMKFLGKMQLSTEMTKIVGMSQSRILSKGRYTLSVKMSDFTCDVIHDGKTEKKN